MDKQKTEYLFKTYPLLYSDKNAPLSESLMAFGFDCGNGWFDLIDELSSKLEPIIQDIVKKNPNLSCRNCGCAKNRHYGSATLHPGKCLTIKQHYKIHPYLAHNRNLANHPLYVWAEAHIPKITRFILKVIKYFYHEYEACHCEEYKPSHPRAAQVKEKFGTLRFYMSSYQEEIGNIISTYEKRSAHVCEECETETYATQTRSDNGWYVTLCETCWTNRKSILRK